MNFSVSCKFSMPTEPDRKLWGHVLTIAKSALTADQALSAATQTLNNGRELCDALTNEEKPSQEKLSKMIKDCKDFVEVASNLATEHKETQAAMYRLLDELKDLVAEKYPSALMDELSDWWGRQWCDQQCKFELTEISGLEKLLPALQLRGLMFVKKIETAVFINK